MEDDLHTVMVRVEELHSADLTQDRIRLVVRHVVRYYRRQRVALKSEDAPFEEDEVFGCEEGGEVRERVRRITNSLFLTLAIQLNIHKKNIISPIIPSSLLEQPLPNARLHILHRIPQLLNYRLALQRLNRVAMRLRRHNNERNDRHRARRRGGGTRAARTVRPGSVRVCGRGGGWVG